MTGHKPRSEVRESRRLIAGKVAAIAGVLALAVSASAGSASAKTKPFCTSGKLTMTIFTFSQPVMAPVIKDFEKYCPGIKVTYAALSSSSAYQTTLQTEKLSHNLADIVETYDTLTPTLETDGLIQPLNQYLTAKQLYPANYWIKGFQQSYIPPKGAKPSLVGKTFALANEADATVYVVNLNELKAAGLTLNANAPTTATNIGNNWTYTQADAFWKKLTSGSQYGVCTQPAWQGQWNGTLKAFGATAMSETGADLDSGAANAAWQELLTPLQQGSAIPFSQLLQGGLENGSCPDNYFTSGEAAMAVEVRGGLPAITAAVKFPVAVLPVPTSPGPGGKQVHATGGGSVGWTVSVQDKTDVPQTLDFLHYLFSAQGQLVAEKTGGVVPAVTSLLSGKNAIWTRLKSNPVNNQAFTIAAQSATIAPQTPGTVFSDSVTMISNMVQSVLSGTPLAQATKTLQSQVIADYKKAGVAHPTS
jgi:ABC-type glycerol-3-phosphate transport system substrate-binding protein